MKSKIGRKDKIKPIAGNNITNLLIIFCVDFFALIMALLIAILIRITLLPALFTYYAKVSPPPGIVGNLWWLPLVAIAFLAYEGLYASRMPYWREYEMIVTALCLAYLIILSLVYLFRIYGEVSRTAILFSFIIALFTVPTVRYLARSYLNRFAFWRQRILIVGAGMTGISVARGIVNEPYLGYEIVGFLDDNQSEEYISIHNGRRVPLLGNTGACQEIADKMKADIVIIAASEKETSDSMVKLANHLHNRVKSLILIPDLVGIPVIGVEADYFFNEQLISLRIRNNLSKPGKLFLKRSFDLIAGTAILLLVLPLMAVISVAIKLNTPGKVIFGQERTGQHGNTFTCLKFRTMYEDAETILQNLLKESPVVKKEWEQNFKLKNDPRITAVGRVLRATSLDELPQLINVLKGEMSLVGPRPRPLYELEQHHETTVFEAGLGVRPGLTGLWQVSGRSELDFRNRIFLDSWYVRNWSFMLDFSIMLRTVWVLYKKSGAY